MEFKQASEMRYNITPVEPFCKPMVYTKEPTPPKEGELIAQGHYNGLNYYVKNINGRHPTAYVEIPQGHKAYSIDFNEIDYDILEVHYGVTYQKDFLLPVDNEGDRCHKFVGWDYGHCTDFEGYYIGLGNSLERESKRWTTEEIIQECKEAIDQINNLTQTEK